MTLYTLSFVCKSGYSHVEEYAASNAEEAYQMAENTFGPIGDVTYATRRA